VKVVVPYTSLHLVTEMVTAWYKPEYVKLTDDDAYRRLLKRLWEERETVVIVEHDIVPWPYAIDELFRCCCWWGAYSYHLHGGIGVHHGFGCTKLGSKLMEALPDIWDEPGHWNSLDQRLYFAAREVGIEPHPHRPAVIHVSEKHIGEKNG
jgi:hypothetical protein